MPAVLVHGVPETHHLWDELRRHLGRDDVVALSLPGFGRPLPDGFAPTMDRYAAWLVEELEGIDGPIDLVGHDWGGILTWRVASLRPVLVRTWVTDAAAMADPGFEWHQMATLWQAPGSGEAVMESWLAQDAAARVQLLEATGLSGDAAHAAAAAFDRTMADAILGLYRSATTMSHDWGPDFHDIGPPGLVLLPSADLFLNDALARRAAARAGARLCPLEGLGHWWMLDDPPRAATALEDFWRQPASDGTNGCAP